MKILISVVLWITGAVLTTLALLTSLFCAIAFWPFDKYRKTVHAQWFWLTDIIVKLSPSWRLAVNGLENIDKNKTYVIVANHQSLADIIVMHKTRMQFKWVAKAGLYKIPFVAVFLFLGKHVMLSKCTIAHIKKFYASATDRLKNGISLVFFPEGTRSETGSLNRFQKGAFKIAIKEKRPILPIFIEGTKKVLPKGSWIINPQASASLTVLAPIDTAGFTCGEAEKLKEIVYAKFKNMEYAKGVI